ncbi:hypothetical protein [Parathermosynechococcus lividus]
MKKLPLHVTLGLLFIAAVDLNATVNAQRLRTATLNVRVFFGSQMGGQLPAPCSAIQIVATPKNGQPIQQAASGPQVGAKGGQCTASLKNVPAGVPIELKAVYLDLPSQPDDSYDLPAGKWTNPLILEPGSTVMKYIKIDGKP